MIPIIKIDFCDEMGCEICNDITKNDDFAGAVINCAIRYCLGRQTYMPSLVIDEVTPILKDCSTKTLRVMRRDVDEWLRDGSKYCYKDIVDKWREFLVEIDKVLENNNT